jgi:16S rRNA (guanine(1405)-N(7))-methyltransferase
MSTKDEQLDQLVAAVRKSAKYNQVCEDAIRWIGAAELDKRRRLKDAVKATKNKLHQVSGAYLERKLDYDGWLTRLSAGLDRDFLREIMWFHASTRERLPILDEFYATLLADLAPVESVIDVACGLNPLAIPWIPLAEDATYTAYDIYEDMIAFVGAFMTLAGVRGRAGARDMIQFVPTERAQVALILKTIPCLEQIDRAAGARLLEDIKAEHVIVSFPAQSLGGREVGMADHYEGRLMELLAGKDWPVKRFEFETELAFLISKTDKS